RRADEPELLRDVARELDQRLVADRHPFDRLAALRLDHRARDRVQAAAVEVAEDVDRELLAAALHLNDRGDGRVRRGEVGLRAVSGTISCTSCSSTSRRRAETYWGSSIRGTIACRSAW